MSIPLLGYIYFGVSFVPVVVGLYRYRIIPGPMKILTLLCILSLVIAAIEFILGRLKIQNQFLANYYVPVELLLIALIYFLSTSTAKERKLIAGGVALFMLVWMIDKIFIEIPSQMNSNMAAVSRFFLVVLSILMISVISRDEAAKLSDKSIFWVAVGVIVYSTGTFIVAGVGSRLLKIDVSLFVIAWHINWLLLIVANLLYTKGLLCESRT
ncbi:MAG: hypothetical protein Q8P51_10005 [Ignavibacteria bacterium]|nr:hypothetical protein [Ignavibacteria bacterium]